jgi:hypothetical protein
MLFWGSLQLSSRVFRLPHTGVAHSSLTSISGCLCAVCKYLPTRHAVSPEAFCSANHGSGPARWAQLRSGRSGPQGRDRARIIDALESGPGLWTLRHGIVRESGRNILDFTLVFAPFH